jgi:hypothetical protein
MKPIDWDGPWGGGVHVADWAPDAKHEDAGNGDE